MLNYTNKHRQKLKVILLKCYVTLDDVGGRLTFEETVVDSGHWVMIDGNGSVQLLRHRELGRQRLQGLVLVVHLILNHKNFLN